MSKMQNMIWKFAAAFLGAVAVQAAAAATPPIHHVFLIVLENEGAGLTFGKHSPAPYLAHDLVAKGAIDVAAIGIGFAEREMPTDLLVGR